MAKKKSPKPRNPNDATFRNIRAIKNRLLVIEQQIRDLWGCQLEDLPNAKKAKKAR